MALEIEDYALIGDCETVALVGKDGSIDWLCWPDFSSPACFAALIGTEQNGRWLLAPKHGCKRMTRRYRDHTLILETRFEMTTGVLLVTDFMPVREMHSDICADCPMYRGNSNSPDGALYSLRLWKNGPMDSWTAAGGPNIAFLRTQQRIETIGNVATAEFTLAKDQHRSFVLTHVQAQEPPPRRINVQKALRQTEHSFGRTGAL